MGNLLNIGLTGLNASRASMKTAGHNLSNVKTPGYSRQRLEQTTNYPIVKHGMLMGTGALPIQVRRLHDANLETRLNGALSEFEFFKQRTSTLREVESIYNEMGVEGLEHFFNKFFNAFRELANQPENETFRSLVRDSAVSVIKDFRRIRNKLDKVMKDLDSKLTNSVHVINQKIEKIVDLNKKIKTLELTGEESSDLRDQRDLNLKELSRYFQTNTFFDDKNDLFVNIKGVGSIITAGENQLLSSSAKPKSVTGNNRDGSTEIFYKGRSKFIITNDLHDGIMGALSKTRNEDVKQLQDALDHLAYGFSHAVNALHRRGFVNRHVSINENGTPASSDLKGPLTGIDFFKAPTEKFDAARRLDLSDFVKEDLTNIATALKPNSPGDNRISLAISKIQHEKIFDGGTASLTEKHLQSIAKIGLETGKSKLNTEQSEGIISQLESLRESISGVSIDEETASLMKYQQVYDASANVIKIADQMFHTVLGTLNR